MDPNFELVLNNYIGYFDPSKCKVERFRPWIQFLNSQTCVSHAMCASALLKIDPLRFHCSSVVIAEDLKSFTFTILNQQYIVNLETFCDVLQFPKDRFDPLPSDDELSQFLLNIHYQGPLQMFKLSKSFLVREWDQFFDTIARVFGNCTKTNFHGITSLNQYIAYAIVSGRRLNFGELLWNVMVNRLAQSRRDFDNHVKVKCWYPRFLTLIINHLLTAEHVELFRNARFETSQTTDSKFYTRLDCSLKFLNTPVLVSPLMSQFINLPIFGEQVPQPHPIPLQVVIPNPGSSSSGTHVETQVVGRADQEVVEPQSLTHVIELNTESNTSNQQPELDLQTSQRSVRKETTMSVPTTLSPPLKKRKTYREASVSPSLSSQQDMDIDMATEQSLETSSQHDESIEIRHRALAICNESSTLPLLTMGEDIHIDETQDTLSGEHFDFDIVPTIVTVEVPSQASEGKSDSQPPLIESFSPLPKGTSLAPLRDFSLAVYTGESERQPGTSSKNMERQLVVRDENQTRSDTQARELSETPLREIEAEKEILKAQVVERSSSSTSVTNQLGMIKDDIEGLKTSLLPKINAVQQSQVLVASDISDLTTSNAQISESVKEIASISAKGDDDDDNADHGGDGGDRREGGEIRRSSEDDFQFDTSGDLEKTIPEEPIGEEEVEEVANFDDWEDEADVYTPDPLFQKELKKQQADLKRKEDENSKVSDIISQKPKIQKAENEDKQRLHSIHVKERRLDVRMKQGSKWDKAREMFDIPQRGTNNDGTFLKLLEKIRTVNPDNSLFMKALKEDILRITSVFDQVRQELYIYVSSEENFLLE
ncbi:hypothetical protein POM88_006930 [Heracleum sosnowskyi]|uniref:Uncharacterized protein n=1 Tax=Heracleum sosnowskyi TaxID=360622 RepID=A0AAD8N5S3_9APIA|nr:hypothetical protein POM88_006930 [Heracleum sosnowskyi]